MNDRSHIRYEPYLAEAMDRQRSDDVIQIPAVATIPILSGAKVARLTEERDRLRHELPGAAEMLRQITGACGLQCFNVDEDGESWLLNDHECDMCKMIAQADRLGDRLIEE